MSAWSSNNPAKPAAPPVSVSDLLGEDVIVLAPQDASKEALIADLAGRLCAKLSLADPGPIVAKVLERERGISTTLDTGASLPHARVDGITKIAAALAVIPGGLKDFTQPEVPIRVVFLFFSPNQKEFFSAHLQLLRAVAGLLQPAFIDALEKAATPKAVLELVRAAEKSKA
jgi:mannitol/fructose-specific phosphotransferase system IIA component (Ntr-type)